MNLDLEIRYTLERGQSGIYAYADLFPSRQPMGRACRREPLHYEVSNQTFNWISVDADRNMLE
jgi:hypothetical protein